MWQVVASRAALLVWMLVAHGPLCAAEAPVVVVAREGECRTVARCGSGWLETLSGYRVLHLKGTPREMGYQQGMLLHDLVRSNMHNILQVKANQTIDVGPLKLTPRQAIDVIVAIQRPYTPDKFVTEMEGLAEAAGLSAKDVIAANSIPELFHCSGFAVMNSATKDGTLYHGRVLDYAIDWGLQEHAVIVVCEPEGGIPFVNVTYAGFIGSVTGMNAEQVSVGEMGGGGLGRWGGMPMALLVREALETGHTLDDAIAVFRDHPRTCQYYYVLADAKTNRAVGMEASWDVFELIQPGAAHPRLSTPVPDCVLLSAGDRYRKLVERTQSLHGTLTPELALELMCRPVAMKSNLHNVLFEPGSSRFWVANATPDKRPAAEQAYYQFDLRELLARQPDPSVAAVELAAPAAGTASAAGAVAP